MKTLGGFLSRQNMGKLHTLKRAIQREPDRWMFYDEDNKAFYACRAFYVSPLYKRIYKNSVVWNKGRLGWFPERLYEGTIGWSWCKKSYRAFVRHVLREMGREAR